MRSALVLIVVAACGKPEPVFTDAGLDGSVSVDGATDQDAAEPGGVRVQVTRRYPQHGQPAPGLTVLFHDAAGALVARAVTDAAGVVRAEVAAGGSVTVVEPDRLTTITELAANDHVAIGDALPTGAPAGTATLTLPPPPPGTTGLAVVGDCVDPVLGAVGGPIALRLTDGCGVGPRRLLAVARQGGGAVRAYLHAPAVDLSSGAATLPGPWSPPATIAASATGAADDVEAASWASLVTASRGRLPLAVTELTVDEGLIEQDLAGVPAGEAFVHMLTLQNLDGSQQSIGRLFATPPASVAFDLTELLPRVTEAGYADDVVTWSTAAPIAVDATLVSLVNESAEGPRDQNWVLLVGPGHREVRLPALPADLRDRWTPEAVGGLVALVDIDPLDAATVRTSLLGETWTGLFPFDPARPGRSRGSQRLF